MKIPVFSFKSPYALYQLGSYTRDIELDVYKTELDKLPKTDWVQLAHDLNYKG